MMRMVWRRSLAALGTTVLLNACGGEGAEEPRRVVIPAGASLRAAGDSLARAGMVRFPAAFRAYARVTGRDRDIRAGTYLLRPDASIPALLTALTEGRGLVRGMTIPEGFSLSWIIPQVAKTLSVPAESVTAAMQDTSLLHLVNAPTPTLEGYIFPETYAFPPGWTARQAVSEMVRRFETMWKPVWDARLDTLKLSRHDIVTLASIIEKEARLPDERPVIAAVYHNRLRIGMPLQADPTVQYARGQHTNRVLYRDLEIDSPYNTYRHAGLPPGPIGSPGMKAIEAALYPARVPYLYFVAHRDGHHEFRTTFREHVAAIRMLRRQGDSVRAELLSRAAASLPATKGAAGTATRTAPSGGTSTAPRARTP